MREVVLLNSGGSDSYCSAIILKQAGYRVTSLFVDYGQPNKQQEMDSARLMMYELGLTAGEDEKRILETRIELAGMVFKEGNIGYESQEIYLRNYVFLSLATQVAYTIGAGNIALGYMNMTGSTEYVDDNPRLLQDLNTIYRDYFGIRLLTPVAGYDKEMIFSTLLGNDVDPLTLPYCNVPVDNKPCMKCEKCLMFQKAVKALKEEREEDGKSSNT